MKTFTKIVSCILVISVLQVTFAYGEEPETSHSDKVEVTKGKYIAGGIVGTAVGFGIGHAIQGRYGDTGYLFTIGDVAATGLYIAGVMSCVDTLSFETTNYGWKTRCNDGLLVGGLIAVIGMHVWETISVWTGATPVSRKRTSSVGAPQDQKFALYVTPGQKSELQAGVQYRF